jgi:hexosaminidase
MKRLLVLMLVGCTMVLNAQDAVDLRETRRSLMPVPASVRFGQGRLTITETFTVSIKGAKDERLQSAVTRALNRLAARTGLPLSRTPADSGTLSIEYTGRGKTVPSLDEDESYSIEVGDNKAALVAATAVGAIRGLETVLQLVEGDRQGFYLPAVTVVDKPRFPWRGVLIDVARHWLPMEVLKRNLDGMAAVKLNVLHLHLTEDQGFRIESKRFPKLQQMGSDGLFYTQDQMREVIAYARERGIRVVPEFDMPGHATSWLVAYPELASAPGPYQIERRWGIFDPAFDPTREDLYKLLDGFLGEMATLFPDEYIHIGGDENNGKQWNANPQIQAFIQAKGLKDNHGLQAYFNRRLLEIVTRHGKKMIGWDEILHPDLPKNAVIQSWRGAESLAQAAKEGHGGILSNGYYLDLMQPTTFHYASDPLPADTQLTAEQQKLVLGGEAAMWSEWVSPETVDSRLWPRLAAIAERLWSPRDVAEVDDMYRRLALTSVQLEDVGLLHEKNPAAMLRRLARGSEVDQLSRLVSVVQPVQGYRRGQMQKATQNTPLTRLVDIARADSASGRRFTTSVNGLLADAPSFRAYYSDVAAQLNSWRDLRPAADVIGDRSPLLNEAAPLMADLATLADAGLDALSHLSNGITPTDEWKTSKTAVLEQAGKPRAALEFAVLPGIRELIVAAGQLPQLKTMTPEEWRKQVKELATPPPPRRRN